MATVEVLLLLAVAAFLAGLAGSYLGIGGGVFLIPFMTLALGIDIKVAIATSLIGVIATSSGAASVYVRDHLTNLRLAMFLEVATTLGAIAAAVATSNFMIGVTAAASAFIYYSQGLVNPGLAAMVIIGVFSGTNLGTRLLVRSRAADVRFLFAIFLAGLGIAMAARALGLFGGVL